jgi:acyl-coenzyme A synthetase/AMP-(fatty) acid ligase
MRGLSCSPGYAAARFGFLAAVPAEVFVQEVDYRPQVALRGTRAAQDVKARLAPRKYRRDGFFVAGLPKMATGKIRRFRLRMGVR